MLLNVHRFGDPAAAPVLCLHGVMGHGGRFRRLADVYLPDRHVVSLDLRGHGLSGWEPPWNLATFVADIVRTLEAEGVGRADLIGFSFGGRLALELAAAHPDRVGRLVLLDPAVQIPPGGALERADAVRPDMSFADAEEAIAARLAGLAHTPRELAADDVAESCVVGEDGRLRHRFSRSAVVAAYGEMSHPPGLPTNCETLLVRAADGIVDTHQTELLRGALGDRLSVVDVPGTHSVLFDALTQTGEATAAHLTPV